MAKRMRLTEVAVGATVTLCEIEGGHQALQRLRGMGLRPGVSVTKVSGDLGGGPVVVRAGGAQTALGRGLCAKVMVEVPE